MKKLFLFTLASSFLFCDISLAAQLLQLKTAEQQSNILIAKRRYGGCRGQGCRGGTVRRSGSTYTTGTAETPQTTFAGTSSNEYNKYMKIAYNAYNKEDYNTALINFKRALIARPNDVYATKAIQSTENRLAGK
ncbi:MAG: hypothetical protein LH649_09940 [Pseudanabaena sp. CAN_BIN31]|nr:hypothetical protein [Pseudanabaena sp. CAN_BIN31]